MPLSSGGGDSVSPGGCFVVAGVAGEAVPEDVDEPVGQGPQGDVVGGSPGALGVVVAACSWRAGERGEHLLIERVGQAPVAGVAGQTTCLTPEARVIGEILQ